MMRTHFVAVVYIYIQQTLFTKATYNKYNKSEEGETTIYLCRYSKDVHRTKDQALTISMVTYHVFLSHCCYKMKFPIISIR